MLHAVAVPYRCGLGLGLGGAALSLAEALGGEVVVIALAATKGEACALALFLAEGPAWDGRPAWPRHDRLRAHLHASCPLSASTTVKWAFVT